MEKRPLGRHDIQVSVIGMGGIVLSGREQADVDRHVAEAIGRGVAWFDVAPTYGDSEERLGPALEPYRADVVLECKTHQRGAQEARAELERSLRRLRTDHLDLYLLHGLSSMEEAERALGPGGAIEVLLEARERGTTRLIGFSAHSDDVALRAIGTGHFDAVLFPLNFLAFERDGLGKRMLEAANARGMGILAIKAMARCVVPGGEAKPYAKCWYIPEDRPDVAPLQVRYTLGLPGVAGIVPPGDPGMFDLALATPSPCTPLTDAEHERLAALTRGLIPVFGEA